MRHMATYPKSHPKSAERSEGDWITIATLSWLQEALLLRARLEGAGITANIPEQFVASIHPAASATRVRVQVRESQMEEARALLQDPGVIEVPGEGPGEGSGEEGVDTASGPVCPRCKSSRVGKKLATGKNVFRFILGLLGGVPMSAAEKKVCHDCGHEWGA